MKIPLFFITKHTVYIIICNMCKDRSCIHTIYIYQWFARFFIILICTTQKEHKKLPTSQFLLRAEKELIGEGQKEGALTPKRYNLIIEIDIKNLNFTHYTKKVVYDVD